MLSTPDHSATLTGCDGDVYSARTLRSMKKVISMDDNQIALPPAECAIDETFPVTIDRSGFEFFTDAPNLREVMTKELRFRAGQVIDMLKCGDWLMLKHHKVCAGGIIDKDDLQFLINMGACPSVSLLVEHLSVWRRCGPNSPLVAALKRVQFDAKLGQGATYTLSLSDFDNCVPLHGADGTVRSVEFADADIVAGQLSVAGTPEAGQFISGFLERADPDVMLALDLPNGEVIDCFDEDGAVLNLRRTRLSSPIALLEVRVRRVQ